MHDFSVFRFFNKVRQEKATGISRFKLYDFTAGAKGRLSLEELEAYRDHIKDTSNDAVELIDAAIEDRRGEG